MARFKPANPSDIPRGRIDGVVYAYNPGTPQIRIWTYPLQRPSDRFLRYNQLVRQLDQQWDTLSDAVKDGWRMFAVDWEDWLPCYLDIDSYPPIWDPDDEDPDDPARRARKQVAAASYTQGLAFVDVAPVLSLTPSDDVLTLSYEPGPVLTWTRTGGAPGVEVYLAVYTYARNSAPIAQGTPPRYTFAMSSLIEVDVPLDLAAVYLAQPGLAAARFVAYRFTLAQAQGLPVVAINIPTTGPMPPP